ncbi:MAG TPA: hypothetical protein VM510_06145 [Caulifigura sp.]|jgi:hypothetical protein|nr:hypothetical protein [Caulifigura sp.]
MAATIELTPEQSAALDQQSIIHGEKFVLMRPSAFIELLGFESEEELRRELQPALDEVDSGKLVPWDIEELLAKLHREHGLA